MAAKLDMEERLRLAFSELLLADSDLAEVVGTRVWAFGDASHRAAYPCILLNIPDSAPAGIMELGWWELHFQVLGAVYRPDDRSLAVLRSLQGLIRGFCEQTDLVSKLNSSTPATAEASALTVVDARIENDVPDEDGAQDQVYAGTSLCVICAPHTATAPAAQQDGSGGGSGQPPAQPIENNNQPGETP